MRPFAETVDPSSYEALPSREAALRRLRYGLERASGPAVVFGAAGTGKTILARTLAHDLGWPTLHAVFPVMSAAEMLGFLAEEWQAPEASGPGLAGSVRRISAFLSGSITRGERPLLIVDEAHLIEDPALFENLRLLLNLQAEKAPGLALVLVGEPPLLSALSPSLIERISAHVHVGALTEDESDAYILGRLRSAGAATTLFDPPTLGRLYRASEGLPRRLNRLADMALMIAYAQERDPDPEIVDIAAREQCFDPIAA